MKAVWLSSTYYLDEVVQGLSPNAERLLTRAMAHCGAAESSGYVSEAAIKMLGLPNPRKLVAELVEGRILVPRKSGGWDFRSWELWNSAGDALIARRKADRDRQARLRAAKQDKSRDPSRDTGDRLNAENDAYSSVEPEKTPEKSPPASNPQASDQPVETHPELHVPESLSRNMSRDVTAPEESRGEKNSGYVSNSATESNGRDGIAATPGAELVREIIPRGHPDAVQTLLRIRANELLKQGHPRVDVAAALQLWCDKPSLGPNVLPSLLSEVIKSRAAPPNGRNGSKVRGYAELAAEVRAQEQQSLAIATAQPKELQ